MLTLNTTRVCGCNPIETAIKITRIGYTHARPGAVIIVNVHQIFEAIAATSLMHHPRNAPILFSNGQMLEPQVINEIVRLKPKGFKGVKIILVGFFTSYVYQQLAQLNIEYEHIHGGNHYETACRIYEHREEFKTILLVSGDDYREGLPVSYWSAHKGDPILFIQKKYIPYCVQNILRNSQNVPVYLIGGENSFSKQTEELLQHYLGSRFNRFTGTDAYELAVNLATYKSSDGNFGWGKNYRNGHAFTFANSLDPLQAVAGSFFAHMGKHTPLLLVDHMSVPRYVSAYIEQIKPLPKTEPHPPFMSGWILGCNEQLSWHTQIEIEQLLSVDHH